MTEPAEVVARERPSATSKRLLVPALQAAKFNFRGTIGYEKFAKTERAGTLFTSDGGSQHPCCSAGGCSPSRLGFGYRYRNGRFGGCGSPRPDQRDERRHWRRAREHNQRPGRVFGY